MPWKDKSKYRTEAYREYMRNYQRSWHQRHKAKRLTKIYERRERLWEFYNQLKENLECTQCGESHPATLQFHHLDPQKKDFNLGEFVPRWLGGIDKLKKELEKCDIVCANCHLKQHYYLGRRQSRVAIQPIADQFARAEEELTPTQNEELAHAIVNNYFPEGIDIA